MSTQDTTLLPDRVPMPQNADQAAAMAMLGEAWLREHAPERLTLSISVQEAWEAAGGNPGIKASKPELLEALRQLDAVCDQQAQQAQGVLQFLANGARYKVSWSDAGCYIRGLPPELSGRWVAFVAADDNCHLAAAPQAEQRTSIEEAATKARKLAHGRDAAAYRDAVSDLGRAYLAEFPTRAALAAPQAEPQANAVVDEPAPNDWRLPADLKAGHVTFRKGVHCSALVSRMKALHETAFGVDNLTPEQKAENLAALQACKAPPHDFATKAEPQPEPTTWSRYVAGMIACYLKWPDDDERVEAVAGIIERRRWAEPQLEREPQPCKLAISPLEEQQMFDDWCPYKGSPDPRVVWAAAIDAANGMLTGIGTKGGI